MSENERMERLRRAARERLASQSSERGSLDPDEVRAERQRLRARDIDSVARGAIADAENRGVFADNPYHGKPLPGLDGRHDPDWWVKRLIERERIQGLGPPALALRREDAELDDRLDAEHDEARVREVLTDFNARIIEARRQLLGGPPVITPLRDVEDEVAAWRSRRVVQQRDVEQSEGEPEAAQRRRRWWQRRADRLGDD
jgi:hypothetical protein